MKSCVISLAAPVENMNRILNSNRLPGGGVAKIGRGQTKQRKHKRLSRVYCATNTTFEVKQIILNSYLFQNEILILLTILASFFLSLFLLTERKLRSIKRETKNEANVQSLWSKTHIKKNNFTTILQ